MPIQGLRTVDLPDALANIFAIYLEWLRTGVLYTRTENKGDELYLLSRACIIGHELRDTDFIDIIHDAVIQCHTENCPELLCTSSTLENDCTFTRKRAYS